MLKWQIFTIFTWLLCSHVLYITIHCKCSISFMPVYNRIIVEVQVFLYPCDLEWRWRSFKWVSKCIVYSCLPLHMRDQFTSIWMQANIKGIVHTITSLPWILILWNNLNMTFNKPASNGSILNFIQIKCKKLQEHNCRNLCFLIQLWCWMKVTIIQTGTEGNSWVVPIILSLKEISL